MKTRRAGKMPPVVDGLLFAEEFARAGIREHLAERPFYCIECGKTFARATPLKVHERVHTGEKPYACETCGKAFSFTSGLSYHRQVHSGKERPFQCPLCNKAFRRLIDLKRHGDRTHHRANNKPLSLEQCGDKAHGRSGQSMSSRRLLIGKAFACLRCGKTFPEKRRLEVHERSHTGERPFQCRVCEKTFVSKEGVAKHARTHGEGNVLLTCAHCERQFTLSTSLKRHMMQKHSSAGKKLVAGDSNNNNNNKASSSSPSGPYSHLQAMRHPYYHCALCDRAFDQSIHLARHVRRHNKNKAGGNEALSASSGFNQWHSLRRAAGERRCPHLHCRKAFVSARTLEKHLAGHKQAAVRRRPLMRRSVGGKQTGCVWCGKTLRSVSDLEIHQRAHAGERPSYDCGACHKRFVYSGFFLRHMRRHAAGGELRGRCLPCHQSFTSFDDLHVHVQMHWS